MKVSSVSEMRNLDGSISVAENGAGKTATAHPQSPAQENINCPKFLDIAQQYGQ